MKPLVSVIVPVYKVEPYLERCLDSLADQTLKEIEIIVIDDGSPDRYGEICDAYAAKDVRFRVVHQENRGLSAARNAGIELARADYLMFVDSDDWVEPEFCRLPYEAAVEHGAELVMFSYEAVKGEKRRTSPRGYEEGPKGRATALRMLLHGVSMMAWNKLYHRRLFSGIRYPVGRSYEDVGTTHRIAYRAASVFFLKAVLYHYVIRKDSITHALTHQAADDRLEMREIQYREMEQWGYGELVAARKLEAYIAYLCAEGSEGRHSAECISNCCAVRSPPEKLYWKSRVLLFLLQWAPPLFDLVCILWRKRIR